MFSVYNGRLKEQTLMKLKDIKSNLFKKKLFIEYHISTVYLVNG